MGTVMEDVILYPLGGVPCALPSGVGLTSELENSILGGHKKVTAMFGLVVSLAEMGFFCKKKEA